MLSFTPTFKPVHGLCAALLLLALLAACQTAPGGSQPLPGASASPGASPTPIPLPVPTPTPPPDPGPLATPTPPLSALGDADVVRRTQTYDLDEAWLSPGGSKLVISLETWQEVELRDGRSARRYTQAYRLLDRTAGAPAGLNPFADVKPFYWYDEQRLAGLGYDAARDEAPLLRLDLAGGPGDELARFERFTYLDAVVGSDGWYYGGSFGTGRPGVVRAVDLQTGAQRDWPLPPELSDPKVPNGRLTLMPMPASRRVLLIEDRTPPAPPFPYPSYSPSPSPEPFEPRAQSTSAPVRHIFQLHTDSGAVEPIPGLQGEQGPWGWPTVAPDGSRFVCSAYGSEGEEIWVYATNGTRRERVIPGRLSDWLSPARILVDRGGAFEVTELASGRILNRIAKPSGRAVFYDPFSRHLVWWDQPQSEGKAPLAVYVQSLREPERPGDERLIRVFTGEDGANFQALPARPRQEQLFMVDRQRLQGPLALYRLKADASELELLFSQPYEASPDFRFDPASADWR